MPKRRHRAATATPLRLSPEGTQALSQLAQGTGWSTNEALSFLVRAGWNALNSGSDQIPALRNVMTAAVAHHETEVAMRKRLAVTAERLRESRRMLDSKQGE